MQSTNTSSATSLTNFTRRDLLRLDGACLDTSETSRDHQDPCTRSNTSSTAVSSRGLHHHRGINIRNELGNTPLHAAIEARAALSIIRMLIAEFGADVEEKNKAGQTALHMAIAHWSGTQNTCASCGGNSQNNTDSTLAIPTYTSSLDDIVRMFVVEFGANVGSFDAAGRPPLTMALRTPAGSTSLEVIRLLSGGWGRKHIKMLSCSETYQHQHNKAFVDATSDDSITCIVNLRDENSGDTPLHVALKNKVGADVIRLLVGELGADVNFEDGHGRAPLHLAVENAGDGKYSDTVQLLLEHGANVNTRRRAMGSSLPHIGRQWVIKMRKGSGGVGCSTPLHTAVERGMAEAARTLLESGADVCARDEFGRTPMELGTVLAVTGQIPSELSDLLFDANVNRRGNKME